MAKQIPKFLADEVAAWAKEGILFHDALPIITASGAITENKARGIYQWCIKMGYADKSVLPRKNSKAFIPTPKQRKVIAEGVQNGTYLQSLAHGVGTTQKSLKKYMVDSKVYETWRTNFWKHHRTSTAGAPGPVELTSKMIYNRSKQPWR